MPSTFFDIYTPKVQAGVPSINAYHAAIAGTDGMCHHPTQFIEPYAGCTCIGACRVCGTQLFKEQRPAGKWIENRHLGAMFREPKWVWIKHPVSIWARRYYRCNA